MIRYLSTLFIAIAATFVACQAKAEKVVVYQEGQLVNPQEVADVLGKTRSIHLLDDAAPAASAALTTPSGDTHAATKGSAAAAGGREQSNGPAAALSLPVRFAFGSADILPEARTQLDALARGIKLLPQDRAVLVEGHTDAVGDDEYNLELSRARARAVRDYLVQHHGIAASRLKTVGYGEARPVEGADPYAAVNRRVQFRGA
ncbi:OmpA family protein [Ramlibacter sp. MMS24-I3-19]|uniref:OmpA family protein n=1 Tax=Ramlibacter sp. MMS24-I3-19 TaxID=3416606 RepID=UPI003D01281A